MKIELHNIKVRQLVDGYINSNEDGVVGYGGKLNIRPAYQREFVYNEVQQRAVVDTIMKGFPLNTMYWVKNDEGTYELLDGQQRTMSICEFVEGNFSIDLGDNITKYYHNLTDDEQNKILDYELTIYFCEGNENERLNWFRTINIAGEKLTNQELLNINYIGSWLSDAKRKFSKTNCVAYKLGSKFVHGSPIRQEYLETVLKWISCGKVCEYMSAHQKDPNANELWLYYQNVISWVIVTFGLDTTPKNYRKEMFGLNWGELYNKYHKNIYEADKIEVRVSELMSNDEVTDKKGVYEYILSGEDENLACKLSKRTFSNADKRTAYERQKGICPITNVYVPFDDMQADHIIPWWKGGTTTLDNLQMISKTANARKSGK
jgi:hypothetical protein